MKRALDAPVDIQIRTAQKSSDALTKEASMIMLRFI
jgi:hypothetical protein